MPLQHQQHHQLHAQAPAARLPRLCTHLQPPSHAARRRRGQRAVAHAAPELLSELHAAAVQHAASLYDVADAAAAAAKNKGGWLAPVTDTLEAVLKYIQTGYDTLHVPHSYGFSIITLTVLVKLATFPFTKKQVESSLAVQTLKPRIDMIKARYGDDKDRVQKETNLLYEQAGVNPLAGCLPSLATIPIFIGLYRSLTNVAEEGLLDTQGFFWIPSLAGPTTIAANRAGAGTAWLFPFVDGAPPIGWHDAICYCILPVALVIAQYISSAIISPPIDPNAENANTQKALYVALPVMVGWFSLNVPSGLSLYYFSNTVFTSAMQIYLRKLGGADVQINDLGPVTKVGSARRMGPLATEAEMWVPTQALAAAANEQQGAEVQQQTEQGQQQQGQAAAAAEAASAASRLVKRKKLVAAGARSSA